MSLFGLFNTAKSAMFASQTALGVVSHNIANANTPGYNRQEVVLEITNPVDIGAGFIGRGVNIASIRRYYDRFIHNQLIGQHQNMGRSFALNQSLTRIEQVFNEARGLGISAPLTDYFNAWHEVSSNPEGIPQRIALINKANTLVFATKRIEREITDNLKNIDGSIDDVIRQINSIASDIARLNRSIVQIEAGQESKTANDLRDQRDTLLNELSNLVEISYFEDSSGSFSITVGMRNLVYGETANEISSKFDEDGKRDIYLDNVNITDRLSKGRLGGFIDIREDIESNSLYKIRKLIASLTKEINLVHRTGYGLDSSTGNDFFNPLQLTVKDLSLGADLTASITDISQLRLDEYEIKFDASNNYYIYNSTTGALISSGAYVSGDTISFEGIDIVISGTVTSSDRFNISPLTNVIKNFGVSVTDAEKVAAASSAATLPGDNNNALSIAKIFDKQITDLGSTTFMDYYRGMISDIGTMSKASSDSLLFDENLLSEIQNRRESLSGVSLDEEAANLIRFQRSFEAAARLIRVTDELLETILNL